MTKVLMVLSSAAATLTGKEAGWYLPEAAQPYYSFIHAGFHVDFASPEGRDPPVSQKSVEHYKDDESVKFLQDQDVVDKLEKCKKISEVNSSEYDAIFYVGGYGPVVDLADDLQNADLVSAFWQGGKIVSAVCHGPAGLIHGKDSNGKSIFEGKKVTCLSNAEEKEHGFPLKDIGFYLEDKIEELGGKFEKAKGLLECHVVVDGQLYTGQNPASAKPLADRIVQDLKQQ
ncbi:class I glutamine amidotransferase-like protein [Thelephora terrestris]|uniref:D-lactate dehydratase n=1 Tax=Thelephora terrestris TaxID=56493 RepID=A0A9P6HIC8_9AGAM|nr:class I glutamine amidotransferase-like protein [Thelephora terrestris]